MSVIRHLPSRALCIGLIGLSLSACRGPEIDTGTNLNLTDAEANANLEMRIKKSAEVRKVIDAVEDALRPLDILLGDLSKAIEKDGTLKEKPEARADRLLARVRELLKKAAGDLVKYAPDGSWSITQDLKLPLNRPGYDCSSSRLRVDGFREQDADRMVVTLQDCKGAAPRTIAELTSSSERITTQFFPEQLEQVGDEILVDGKKYGSCQVTIKKSENDIVCEPIEIKGEDLIARIDPIQFHDGKGPGDNVSGHIKLVANRASTGDLIVHFEVEKVPGSKARVELKTKN